MEKFAFLSEGVSEDKGTQDAPRPNFLKNAKSDLRFLILTLSSILAWTFNEKLVPIRKKIRIQNKIPCCFSSETLLYLVLNAIFFLPGTDRSLKAQARMENKVSIKNLKSLFTFLRNLAGK